MTFDEAFDLAARSAVYADVEGPPRTWLQRLRLTRRERFRPTAAERIAAVEACRELCRHSVTDYGGLPAKRLLEAKAQAAVGSGVLTLLWVAVMVTALLRNLRELLQREDSS